MHHQISSFLLIASLGYLTHTVVAGPSIVTERRAKRSAVSYPVSFPYGQSTINIPRPLIGNVPYGTIIKQCTVASTVALTFDDGPSQYTDMVLDVLAEYGARATFFVNGINNPLGSIDDPATPWPALLRRMHAEGHQIGSHTWDHADLSSTSPHLRGQEIVFNEMAIRNVIGSVPTYLRPPYASCTHASGCLDDLLARGYHIINFDIDTMDYSHNDPQAIQWSKDHFEDMLSRLGRDHQQGGRTGHISLSHDTKFETAANLTSFMLDTLQDLGYRSVTVGECLGDPSENWYRDDASPRSAHSIEDIEDNKMAALRPSRKRRCGPKMRHTYRGSNFGRFGRCCSRSGL